MTAIWLLIIAALLLIFGISIQETIAGILIAIIGLYLICLKFNFVPSTW